MRACVIAIGLLALATAGSAAAHLPTTGIGRAVGALGSVPVSYDPGAAVSDVEAGGFPQIVGSNPKVAFLAASVRDEIAGGDPDAVAAEIAREADLDGTLVVLVGTEPGAWSDEIGEERLTELVRSARAQRSAASPAVMVEALVRSVQSEPVDSDPPWGWIGAALLVASLGALVALDRSVRRRP